MPHAVAHQNPEDGIPTAGTAVATPMEMLSHALQNGASVEMMEKLMALEERWQKNRGRREFDAAISAAKGEIPVIIKNRVGNNNKRYADFAAIVRVVDPILRQYGLSYRFRTDQDEKLIRVTCVLSHEAGHSEENTLMGPADNSGNKNAIQSIGSTLQYLQRYSLTQALGLAASEDDDDGKAAGIGETITDEQSGKIRKLIEETGTDIAKFCQYHNVEAVPDIPAAKFDSALRSLEKKRAEQTKARGQSNG